MVAKNSDFVISLKGKSVIIPEKGMVIISKYDYDLGVLNAEIRGAQMMLNVCTVYGFVEPLVVLRKNLAKYVENELEKIKQR